MQKIAIFIQLRKHFDSIFEYLKTRGKAKKYWARSDVTRVEKAYIIECVFHRTCII